MSLWQRAAIALARSTSVTTFMQKNRSASALAQRFVGGRTVEDVVHTASRLADQGIRASLFYLGEYVDDPKLIAKTVARKIAAAKALYAAGLDVHISIDPTAIGFLTDEQTCRDNAVAIGRAISEPSNSIYRLLMLDMEDYNLVPPTLSLYQALANAGIPVGQTLQAYLRRTEEDLHGFVQGPNSVRLVKGAFAARRDIAFSGRGAITRNYLKLAAIMLSREAKTHGFYPIFATHDHRLIAAIRDLATDYGWGPRDYEFEMLFGVRPALQDSLVAQGQTVRLYLPFGEDWWPYAARRLGETPRNARLLLRALI